MTPEQLQAWLQANGLTGGSESDPYNLGDYDNGAVIGNSGIGKRNDESVEAFLARLAEASTDGGKWGTAGRGFNDMQSAGFVNTLAPVTIDGVQYHRVGENIADPEFRKRLLSSDPKGNIAKFFNQYDPTSVSRQSAEYGPLMQKDKYDELVRAIDSTKSEGFFAENSPWDAFSRTIGVAMGISGLAAGALGAAAGGAGASTFGSGLADWAGGALANAGGAGVPYQSLWSSLGANAASQGGSWADILTNFGIDPSSMPDMPWGVNARGDGFDSNWLGEAKSLGNPELDAFINSLGPKIMETAGSGGFIDQAIANSALSGGGSWLDKLLKGAGASTAGKILTGTAGLDDYLKAAGVVGSTALGMYGAERQAGALSGTADKYLALGAPFRSKLAESYGPNFDLAKADPAYAGALDQASNSVLKNLSTAGNPFDNPGTVMEAQKYVTQSTALPQLNTYRSQLGGFGQLGINTAGTADLGAAQASTGGLDALGYGIGQLTGSNNSFEDILKKYGGILGNKGFSLNTGSGF